MERRDGKSINNPNPDPVQKMEMMEEIWERKRNLESFPEIAAAMGISASTAWKYFHEYKLYLVPPNVEQERLMGIAQLEEQLAQANKMMGMTGNDIELKLKVAEHIRKLLADYRKLQGLDAAKKYEHKLKRTTETDEAIEELMEKFGTDMEGSEARAERRRQERAARFRR